VRVALVLLNYYLSSDNVSSNFWVHLWIRIALMKTYVSDTVSA